MSLHIVVEVDVADLKVPILPSTLNILHVTLDILPSTLDILLSALDILSSTLDPRQLPRLSLYHAFTLILLINYITLH